MSANEDSLGTRLDRVWFDGDVACSEAFPGQEEVDEQAICNVPCF